MQACKDKSVRDCSLVDFPYTLVLQDGDIGTYPHTAMYGVYENISAAARDLLDQSMAVMLILPTTEDIRYF